VVSADAPYSTTLVVMPDGRILRRTLAGNPGDAPMTEERRLRLLNALLETWTADTELLLDGIESANASRPIGRFTGRLDLGAVGIVGHSFGGATAAEVCLEDDRCRAGVDLDGALYGPVIREGLRQPFLFLLSDHGIAWRSPDCTICADIRSAAARKPENKLIVTLLGAHHFSFSDAALLQSRVVRSMMVALGGPGRLPPRVGLAATTSYLRDFFAAHLLGDPDTAFETRPLIETARIENK